MIVQVIAAWFGAAFRQICDWSAGVPSKAGRHRPRDAHFPESRATTGANSSMNAPFTMT